MLSSASFLVLGLAAATLQSLEPPQPVSSATFVGTWVGLQTVADNRLPGAREGQTVTLTIENVNGRLIGVLNPFFGGHEGARFVDVRISRDELKASAVVGGSSVADMLPAWKNDTRIRFTLKADRTRISGTADVELRGVKWMRYNYDLEKKRSRY